MLYESNVKVLTGSSPTARCTLLSTTVLYTCTLLLFIIPSCAWQKIVSVRAWKPVPARRSHGVIALHGQLTTFS